MEAVAQRCSIKKVFSEILQNSQKTPVPESVFNKVTGLNFIKKEFFPVKFAKL